MTRENCKIENFKDSDIKYLFGYSEQKNKIAKFFEYDHDFLSSPHISKIRVFIGCEIESCNFAVEIFSVGENGNPGIQINNEEITGYAKEGNHWTAIDVSDLKIKFPEQGLFVGLKWLITDENFYEFDGHKKDPTKRFTFSTYAPQFGTYPKDDKYLWVFKNGVWEKEEKNTIKILRKYENMYTEPAIELGFEN